MGFCGEPGAVGSSSFLLLLFKLQHLSGAERARDSDKERQALFLLFYFYYSGNLRTVELADVPRQRACIVCVVVWCVRCFGFTCFYSGTSLPLHGRQTTAVRDIEDKKKSPSAERCHV